MTGVQTCALPISPGEARDLRGFVANQTLIFWPFTDLGDTRLRWGTRYITLRQDRDATRPNKIGMAHEMCWVGYLNGGTLFVKGLGYEAGRVYADRGSNFETFTNKEMLEIESLGPVQKIAPGGAIEQVERWWLIRDIGSETTDAAIDRNIRPKVEALLRK